LSTDEDSDSDEVDTGVDKPHKDLSQIDNGNINDNPLQRLESDSGDEIMEKCLLKSPKKNSFLYNDKTELSKAKSPPNASNRAMFNKRVEGDMSTPDEISKEKISDIDLFYPSCMKKFDEHQRTARDKSVEEAGTNPGNGASDITEI
jgi:hypothetical protein